MNLEQLRYFVSVCETGSYSITANKMVLTPQAVSKSLKQLSVELGHALFEKSGTKLVPTSFGQSIYTEARRVVWNANAIQDKAKPRAIKANLPTEVHIGIGYAPIKGVSIVPEQIQLLKNCFPKTHFEIAYASNESCFLSLERGLFDVCIVNGSYPSSTIPLIKLRTDAPALAMDSAHNLARKEMITLKDLSRKIIAQPSDINYFFHELTHAFEERGLKQPAFTSMPFGLNEYHKLLRDGGLVFVDPKTSTIEDLVPDVVLREIDVAEFPPLIIGYAYQANEESDWKQYLGNIIKRVCYDRWDDTELLENE